MMKYLLEEAYRISLATEQKSQDLYLNAVVMLPAGNGKMLFERLARHETTIMNHIMERCPQLASTMQHRADEREGLAPLDHADALPELRLLDVLQLAVQDKAASVARYQTFIETFREPAVRDIFQPALALSRNMLQDIKTEYRQAEQRLHRPAVNRRAKRTHIRTTFASAPPDKHSQLFISLLDSGRRRPL